MKPVLSVVRLGAFLALAGCANHPLDCATGLVAWDDCLPGTKGYEMRQSKLTRDDELCKSYGLVFGTPAYGQCRVSLQNQSDANRQAMIGAYLASQPRPVTCTTIGTGGMASTSCQ